MWIIKIIKFNAFNLLGYLTNTDASILVYKFRPKRTGFNKYAEYTRLQLTFLSLHLITDVDVHVLLILKGTVSVICSIKGNVRFTCSLCLNKNALEIRDISFYSQLWSHLWISCFWNIVEFRKKQTLGKSSTILIRYIFKGYQCESDERVPVWTGHVQ